MNGLAAKSTEQWPEEPSVSQNRTKSARFRARPPKIEHLKVRERKWSLNFGQVEDLATENSKNSKNAQTEGAWTGKYGCDSAGPLCFAPQKLCNILTASFMHWMVPSKKDAANGSLEKRLRAADVGGSGHTPRRGSKMDERAACHGESVLQLRPNAQTQNLCRTSGLLLPRLIAEQIALRNQTGLS